MIRKKEKVYSNCLIRINRFASINKGSGVDSSGLLCYSSKVVWFMGFCPELIFITTVDESAGVLFSIKVTSKRNRRHRRSGGSF